ncbi:heme ABC transporter substrate-binding protein IsdE [Alkalicoccobacillus gibsonii]|uniref:heme ABC transporter substrate-binding protein IsdE n=1 Tax=Alkalicoccobacillus gibsonii TaxID=79881 RepID=UPI003515951A
MKKSLLLSFSLSSLVLFACQPMVEQAGPAEYKSHNGESEQEERVIATTVSTTELADALELELVGIPTSYKDLPTRYEGVTEIGNPMSPDMESIRSLQPDSVWSVTTLQVDLEDPFLQAGVDADFLDLQSVESMINEILQMGEAYDRREQATSLIDSFTEKIEQVENEIKGLQPPSVLILMGVPGSYLVATEHSYIGDLVRLAGGINVIQGENEAEYLASNTEYLQQANPDVILRAAHGMPREVIDMFDEEFQTNDIWKHFNAVKTDRVYDLEELLFGTTGNIAVVEALDELQKMLYPRNESK